MYKLYATLIIALGFMAVQPLSNPLSAGNTSVTIENGPDIPGPTLRYILETCQATWWSEHQFTYGDLRSAYNRGEIWIYKTAQTGGDYYDVYYGGIYLCVIDSNF